MCDNWLEAPDQSIDARQLAEEVRQRLDGLQESELPMSATELGLLVETLRRQMLPSSGSSELRVVRCDCDIIPRDYTIDWRVPILGPIHALVRRLINAEIRRYLMPTLEKQSYLNRQFLQILNDLRDENDRLRRRIKRFPEESREGPEP